MPERIVRFATVMADIVGGHAGQQQQIAGVRLIDFRVRSIVQRVDAMLLPRCRRRRPAGEQAGEQQSVAGPDEEGAFRLGQCRIGHVDRLAGLGVAHWKARRLF